MSENHNRRKVRNPSVNHKLIDSILGVDVSEIVESVIKEPKKEAREEVIRNVNMLLYDLKKINDMKNQTNENFGGARDRKPLKPLTSGVKQDNRISRATDLVKKQKGKIVISAVKANGNPQIVSSVKTKIPDKNKREVSDKLEERVKAIPAKSKCKNVSKAGKNDSPDKKNTLVVVHNSAENVNKTKLKSSGGVRRPGATKQIDATSK